ncbi:unnamed protein product [Cylindrotheca closterium]|uniref:Uncharacterized protein n=1 Tax=Cylindrotheca closterium TaxID=2856 RepID=A0AAD2FF74_9STRA|nr:unnamed protein product [Cylindrotheca closterium]
MSQYSWARAHTRAAAALASVAVSSGGYLMLWQQQQQSQEDENHPCNQSSSRLPSAFHLNSTTQSSDNNNTTAAILPAAAFPTTAQALWWMAQGTITSSTTAKTTQCQPKPDPGYPDLSRFGKHSYLKKYLTPEIYAALKKKKTAKGVTLEDVIQSGVTLPYGARPVRGCGIYAGDAESYQVFAKLLDPIVEDWHHLRSDSLQARSNKALLAGPKQSKTSRSSGKPVKGARISRQATNLNPGFVLRQNLDPDGEYILQTRMRVARSVRGFPFSPKISREQRRELEGLIQDCTRDFQTTEDEDLTGTYTRVMDMTNEQHGDWIHRHILFHDPDALSISAGLGKDWPDARGIYMNRHSMSADPTDAASYNVSPEVMIWVNAEDHLRIISMNKGGDLLGVFTRLSKAIGALEASLKKRGYGYESDPYLGFLNTSPENLGTALRASVFVKLPRLGREPGFDELLARLRLEASTRFRGEFNNNANEESDDYSEDEDFSFLSDFGLMITIHDGHIQLHLCPDANFPEIHPNVYAPSVMDSMETLAGGGSGVAVFGGHHPELGDIVMKHGGYKDMHELFALATIENELKKRGDANGGMKAAIDMQRRLPEFRMIYISPSHIVEKRINRWENLKSLVDKFSSTNNLVARGRQSFRLDESALQILNSDMSIRLYETDDVDKFTLQLDIETEERRSLAVILPKDDSEFIDHKTVMLRHNSYEELDDIAHELIRTMTERLLKFTLAQKTIGGETPRTGNQWLYSGQLHGAVLENLISQFILVIRHLQEMTLPEEVDVVDQVREELNRFECDPDLKISEISNTANTFVGNAIRKNFHEEKGRIRFLQEMGKKFRVYGLLVLTPEEELPAKMIGRLLEEDSRMSDVFLDSPQEDAPLNPGDEFWKNILRRAVDTRDTMSPSALERIWDCGLADAGIHNLFVTEDDLFLFDLGEPELQSLPGFLTKFLFSFFHTLGMEEDDETGWVRRFDMVDDKLALSQHTKELLPQAYDAFQVCLDRLIEEVLDGDKGLRWLLLQYVTLQLLSDTAFCLQKWCIKGGGQDREHNHQRGIEKWLWRALWDIHIACDINTQDSWARLGVDAPQLLARTSLLEGTTSISKLRESVELFSNSLREINELQPPATIIQNKS